MRCFFLNNKANKRKRELKDFVWFFRLSTNIFYTYCITCQKIDKYERSFELAHMIGE